jgi:hypothetical protein
VKPGALNTLEIQMGALLKIQIQCDLAHDLPFSGEIPLRELSRAR